MKADFDFRPAPFWFLNHRLEEGEWRRQLDLMADCGVSGVFLHPRAGSFPQTYGSREWFDTLSRIVRDAEERGLKVWLYDEDPFPSGAAGGRIAFEDPSLAARSVTVLRARPDERGRVSVDLGQSRPLAAYALLAKDGEAADVIDLSESVGTVRERYFSFVHRSSYYCDMIGSLPYPHWRAETYLPQMRFQADIPAGYEAFVAVASVVRDSDKYGFIPDNLSERGTRRFLELTHEKYAEALGDKFGGTIPGIFTDEPKSGGAIPWTEGIEEIFFAKHGYRIEENWYHFAASFGEKSRKVREDYLGVVNDLVSERFYGRVAKWCGEHGLALTGHMLSEEDPVTQAMLGEDVYRSAGICDIPGFDILGRNLGDGDHFSLAVGAKIVSSRASQQGKPVVMSECLACNPYNFGADGMMRAANFLFAFGVTWLVPHGFYYSYAGLRKRDAGTSFFFQHKDFSGFPAFSAYAARTGRKLAGGSHVCDTCLVLPTRDFRRLAYGETAAAERLRATVFACALALTRAGISWEIADDRAVCEARGELRVGRSLYRNAVVPEIEESGDNAGRIREKLSELGVFVLRAKEAAPDLSELLPRALGVDVNTVRGPEGTVVSFRKRDEEGEFVFLFNNSPSEALVSVGGNYGRAADAESGKTYRLARAEGRSLLSLRGYRAVFLEEGEADGEIFPCDYLAREETYESDLAPEWEYVPPDPRVKQTFCDWRVRLERADGAKLEKTTGYGPVRNAGGTTLSYLADEERRPYADAAPVVRLYPAKASFVCRVRVPEEGTWGILFEEDTFQGDCRLYADGREFDPRNCPKEFVYDFTNRLFVLPADCRGREIELSAQWERAGEFDGIYSAIYLFSCGEEDRK